MSIATTSLKYGWKVLAILTLGGASIFVADNQLRRITTATRIEIALGVTERCLATQTGTNADGSGIYSVTPPSIVRTWTDTNGASVIMTNALEWRDDLSMKTELDVKLKALCPFYVDANSVYDGTTNIVMLTFTGLLTSLDLGDHTNFTSIPAIGTNAATFGPWAWRNYVVAWQERYKVLNALKMTRDSTVVYTGGRAVANTPGPMVDGSPYNAYQTNTWSMATIEAETRYSASSNFALFTPPYNNWVWRNNSYTINTIEAGTEARYYSYSIVVYEGYRHYYFGITADRITGDFFSGSVLLYRVGMARRTGTIGSQVIPTNGIAFNASLYSQGTNYSGYYSSTNGTFDNHGDNINQNYELRQTRSDRMWFDLGNSNFPMLNWCSVPVLHSSVSRGYKISRADVFYDWQFNYCTNRFWE